MKWKCKHIILRSNIGNGNDDAKASLRISVEKIPTFGRGSTTAVARKPISKPWDFDRSFSFLIHLVRPPFSLRITDTERPAPLVPSLGRVASPLSRFMDVEALSLRRGSFIAFHFRDEFARPIGAWQKCNATTEVRGHRIVCVRQEKQGLPSSSRVASRVSPRWRRENIYWMLSHTSGHVLVTVLHRSPYEIGSLLKWISCGRVIAAILDPLVTR